MPGGLRPQVIGGAASGNGFSRLSDSPITLPQHPDQQRPKCLVLLAVDQELLKLRGRVERLRPSRSSHVGIVMTDGTLDTTFCGDGMVERSFERVRLRTRRWGFNPMEGSCWRGRPEP